MISSSSNHYGTRHLSLRECEVGLGSLNKEVVRSLWASLAFELLYLTNDDEERYSIQAEIAHIILILGMLCTAAEGQELPES